VLFALALIVLSVLLRFHWYAELDSHAIDLLARVRSAGLVSAFGIVTTMGDVVPCLLIATGLAMVFFRVTGDLVRSLVLPTVVLIQVLVQVALGKIFHDLTLDSIRPDLVIGGVGPIPSGSVSRLFSIFLVASLLWSGYSAITASRLAIVGSLAVLVELVSRLYLGRHFLTDIVGGLLLGILLVVAAAWLLELLPRHSDEPVAKEQPETSS
jgi:undecaprenyl-diphosphatase